MGSYKFPYISDKRMYAAVMGACSYIRETGYFNKAVSYYSNKYNVDSDELAAHIRARQSVGQRAKAKKRKYNYYVLIGYWDFQCSDDAGSFVSWDYSAEDYKNKCDAIVIRATSEKKAKSNGMLYPDSCYGPALGEFFCTKHVDVFGTKKEAEKFASSCTWDSIKEYLSDELSQAQRWGRN